MKELPLSFPRSQYAPVHYRFYPRAAELAYGQATANHRLDCGAHAGSMYGNSGVMTFIVDQDGSVLQKDLGPNSARIAAAMTEFNPDATWTTAKSE